MAFWIDWKGKSNICWRKENMFSRNKSLNQSIAHLPRWREAMKRERESPLNVRNLYACNVVPPPVMLLNPMNELFGYIMLHHLKHGDSVTHIFYDRFLKKLVIANDRQEISWDPSCPTCTWSAWWAPRLPRFIPWPGAASEHGGPSVGC